jgi:hypothetical protein
MKEKMTGREVRNALLREAINLLDFEEALMDDWLAKLNASLRGTLEGSVLQRDVVRCVADLISESYSPEPLTEIATKIEGWAVHELVRAIGEYGHDHYLSLGRDMDGNVTVTKVIFSEEEDVARLDA